MNAGLSDFHGLGIEIDDKVAGLDDALGVALGAADDRVDAGDQLVLMEWLRQVVVGAEAEALDLVFRAGEARKDQNRGFYLRNAQGAQDFKARHVRQVQVQQDDVVIIEFAEIDTLFAEIRRIDVKTLGFEHQLNRLRYSAVVLNKHNAHANPLPCLSGLRSARRKAAPWNTPWDKPIRSVDV